MELPDNIVLSEGLRWVSCDICNIDKPRILIIHDDSPSCSNCDSMTCPDHLDKCSNCNVWLCSNCYADTEVCKISDHMMCPNCVRKCRCSRRICKGCMEVCNWCQEKICYECIISCGRCGEYTYICNKCASPCRLCGVKTCRCCWDTRCKVCNKCVSGTFCKKCDTSERVHTLHS